MVFRDVSERRRAELALNKAYEQLERTAAELRRSNEDLSQFGYVASHDLRSPLKTVTMFSQLLDRKYGDTLGEGKELLAQITTATKRMATLIDDLLRFSTITATREYGASLVNATKCLETAIDNLRSSIEDSGTLVEYGPLPEVPIDETSLVQLFQNLIGNSIRYRSEQNPRIVVSAVEHDGFWRFSCRDNGIGIAPEYTSRIFEPFKRLHGPEVPGSGIGLAVCKKVVQRYGGEIWVESTVGEGSTFYFTLPMQMT
jgi:light-regulated signal transduction histidine kinase (bacteriophytochrome)